jgi:hypothetical protein
MGNILSEEKIDLAIKQLEDLIWEHSQLWIQRRHVIEILKNCNISSQSAKNDIEIYFLAKEKEHERKGIIFKLNGAIDMHSHHMSISRRYGKVGRLMYVVNYEM